MNGTRLLLRAALITAGFVAADGVILYFGTDETLTFLHRWVLMVVGVGSGIAWAALMMRQRTSRNGISKSLQMKSP